MKSNDKIKSKITREKLIEWETICNTLHNINTITIVYNWNYYFFSTKYKSHGFVYSFFYYFKFDNNLNLNESKNIMASIRNGVEFSFTSLKILFALKCHRKVNKGLEDM